MTVRIYEKQLNRWTVWNEDFNREELVQAELEYREYEAETGEVVRHGTEDIQYGRGRNSKNRTRTMTVYTWDGMRVNKGGHRWWEQQKTITYRPSDRKALGIYLKRIYPKAAEIQLRTY